jgi:HK97 family phage major capsid protein
MVKKLKDTQGRPLFQPGLANKEPDTINGYPYQINQSMAVMAANAKSIAFGQLSKYFIRNVAQIEVLRLTERYADFGQVGFLAFSRADGNLLDAGTNPVKYYANSAT